MNDQGIDEYQMETDVVVVGYGGSGAASAISARENGADVIILEKMPVPGGNTKVSAGKHPLIKRSQDFEKYAAYLKVLCFNTVDPEIVDAFVNGLRELPDWIKSMGGELVEWLHVGVSYSFNVPHPTHPGIPQGKGMEISECHIAQNETYPEPTAGARLWGVLTKQVERMGIKVLLATPAKELIRNQKGEITGVMAESDGKKVFIKAKKGVIMSCGGFENDDALKRDCLDPRPLAFFGSPGNTGDGIRMVQKIGAALWHMNRQVSCVGFKAPEFDTAFFIDLLAPGFIFVDKDGKRFVNESAIELHEAWRVCSRFDDLKRYDYSCIPFYAIFDEELRKTAPLNMSLGGYNVVMKKYQWSEDNSAEIARGWISKANSISEIAQRISVDPKVLEDTVARYNAYCQARQDDDFSRSRESLKAIQGPPYYAIPLGPVLVNTQGGARRDKDGRVLDPDGQPIPRLYAAGEFGSMWGFLYEAAGNVPEITISGRIAGRSAAANPPM